jgi:hypothetical protein
MRIKEKHYGPTLWGIVAAILIAMAIISSCATTECLVTPNPNDRTIVGYTNYWGFGKGNTHYKVIDGKGFKATPIKIEGDTLNIGDHLICETGRNSMSRY